MFPYMDSTLYVHDCHYPEESGCYRPATNEEKLAVALSLEGVETVESLDLEVGLYLSDPIARRYAVIPLPEDFA